MKDIHGPNFVMSVPDIVGQTVRVKGRKVYFDYDERFGPLVTDKDGQPLAKQPIAENHPFWAPFMRWLADYNRSKADG